MLRRRLVPAMVVLLLALSALVAARSASDHAVHLPLVAGGTTPTPTRTTAPSPTPDGPLAYVIRVVDGDTIDVSLDGESRRVDYLGIDAPDDPGACYTRESAMANAELVLGKWVLLERDVSETGPLGQLLRYVHGEGVLVNAELVRRGCALAATDPPDVRYAGLIVQLQGEAREAGRGLWSACLTPSPTVPQPGPTGTPTPTAVVPSRRVIIAPWCSQFDAPGDDDRRLNEEYVCLENWGDTPADLTGWHIRDEGNHVYTFPAISLAARARLALHSGAGVDTPTDLYWGRDKAVWNDTGDVVYLYDAAWNPIDTHAY